MQTIAVVALSARAIAEAAARDGYAVLAVDLFGDADTRRACQQWWPAGAAGSLQLDPALVMAALRQIAQRGDVLGWVPGSGCEGLPALMAEAATVLPLLGTPPQAMQRVRDPLAFFDLLDKLAIAHPEVRHEAPTDLGGWLLKNAHGCGGWHIQTAAAALAGGTTRVQAPHYLQRRAPGLPMSATFCAVAASSETAASSQALLLGFNQLIVRPQGGHPYVYAGVVGPVPLAATPARAVQRAVQALCANTGLRGLCSLDFVLDGDQVQVLEVNPRVPASVALYGERVMGGVMAAHVNACQPGQPGPLPGLQPETHPTGTRSSLRPAPCTSARNWRSTCWCRRRVTICPPPAPVCSAATRCAACRHGVQTPKRY